MTYFAPLAIRTQRSHPLRVESVDVVWLSAAHPTLDLVTARNGQQVAFDNRPFELHPQSTQFFGLALTYQDDHLPRTGTLGRVCFRFDHGTESACAQLDFMGYPPDLSVSSHAVTLVHDATHPRPSQTLCFRRLSSRLRLEAPFNTSRDFHIAITGTDHADFYLKGHASSDFHPLNFHTHPCSVDDPPNTSVTVNVVFDPHDPARGGDRHARVVVSAPGPHNTWQELATLPLTGVLAPP